MSGIERKTIVEKIGVSAVLETCAEECNELAQACLKLSRKLRNENPTPKTKKELLDSLAEELADVTVCIDAIMHDTELVDWDSVYRIADFKLCRWHERIDNNITGE